MKRAYAKHSGAIDSPLPDSVLMQGAFAPSRSKINYSGPIEW
jgi:hypothetical protein